MFTRTIGWCAAALSLLVITLDDAQATLIGDTVNFQCTNCGPPTSDSFVVLSGMPELALFDQLSIDVEAASLRIDWLFQTIFLIEDIRFEWNGLDEQGVASHLVSVSINPASTWGLAPPVTVEFGPDFVHIMNNGDTTVTNGDFIQLDLQFSQVPEPAPAALLVSALAGGMLAVRRRSKSHVSVALR